MAARSVAHELDVVPHDVRSVAVRARNGGRDPRTGPRSNACSTTRSTSEASPHAAGVAGERPGAGERRPPRVAGARRGPSRLRPRADVETVGDRHCVRYRIATDDGAGCEQTAYFDLDDRLRITFVRMLASGAAAADRNGRELGRGRRRSGSAPRRTQMLVTMFMRNSRFIATRWSKAPSISASVAPNRRRSFLRVWCRTNSHAGWRSASYEIDQCAKRSRHSIALPTPSKNSRAVSSSVVVRDDLPEHVDALRSRHRVEHGPLERFVHVVEVPAEEGEQRDRDRFLDQVHEQRQVPAPHERDEVAGPVVATGRLAQNHARCRVHGNQ